MTALEQAACEYVWARRRFVAAYCRVEAREVLNEAWERLGALVPVEGSSDAVGVVDEERETAK